MDIEIQNLDEGIAILNIENQQNFKIQIFFTNYDVKSVGSTSNYIKIEREVAISSQVGLEPRSTTTLTGQVNLINLTTI